MIFRGKISVSSTLAVATPSSSFSKQTEGVPPELGEEDGQGKGDRARSNTGVGEANVHDGFAHSIANVRGNGEDERRGSGEKEKNELCGGL
ncbi:hypothetical protein E2562_020188 [Oryza meyeriana var. granulata]|uniref:DUF834 domain-containing protein n=1 Tax=Oryza meyeriana var. granulata TaxID=110450 RepID=A0A6G1BLZ0_9ORYZ|nr:hypothetical protein E2562_020188 [Oryza meyeriana var. granulata]